MSRIALTCRKTIQVHIATCTVSPEGDHTLMRLMMCRRESLPGSLALLKCKFAAWAEGMLRMVEWPTCSVRQQQLLQHEHLLLLACTAYIVLRAIPWIYSKICCVTLAVAQSNNFTFALHSMVCRRPKHCRCTACQCVTCSVDVLTCKNNNEDRSTVHQS